MFTTGLIQSLFVIISLISSIFEHYHENHGFGPETWTYSGELYRLRSIYLLEHWIYFSCHQLEWEAFDPISKKWVNLPMMNPDIDFKLSGKVGPVQCF
ncbi:hypothetical protein HanPSC8_Chr04g0147921 [Helianthus annuus]|nr:hypothetical protein HanPSC8_Chr04g0147921 [Helianthus annuus]